MEELENQSFEEAASQAYDSMTSESTEQTQDQDTSQEETQSTSENTQAEDTPFSWDTVDERARKEYETAQERYKNLQSMFSRRQNEWKSHQEKLSSYEPKVKQYDYFDKLVSTNPELRSALERAVGVKSSVAPEIEQDPLYGYINNFENKVGEQIRPLLEFVQNQQKQAAERELDAQVDRVTKEAVDTYKEVMGREPSKEELAKIYQHMHENRVYHGKSAALSVFHADIVKAQVQKALSEQTHKKGIGARVSSVNSAKGKSTAPLSVEAFLDQQLSEMGIN